jgi:glycosyltransferase involved in cell wall biosynthesis
MPDSRALVSVVVPCFNEEAVLGEMHRRLRAALDTIDGAHEIVYVDDGSRDGTAEMLRRLFAGDPDHVRVVRLSRNFGHQLAVTAGIDHAAGDAVVLIDADLQDPPESIPAFVARWREGFQVVYGVRRERHGEFAFKRWTASLFYRLLGRISEIPIPLDTGDFRLLDRVAVNALRRMGEHDRFIRGMASWVGYRQTAVPYVREARFAGASKYSLVKMMRFATDGIVSFSTSPLRFVTWLGIAASLLATAGIVYAIGHRLAADVWLPGGMLLGLGMVLLGGVQMIALGILGEYVGRIYREAKRRPLYLVRETLGLRGTASTEDPLRASGPSART